MEYVTKTVHEVDWQELERYIEQELGHPYEIVAVMETSNDTSISVNVTPNIYDFDQAQVEKFIKTGETDYYTPSVHSVMEYLCKQGKLREGNWLIQVSW